MDCFLFNLTFLRNISKTEWYNYLYILNSVFAMLYLGVRNFYDDEYVPYFEKCSYMNIQCTKID